MKNSTLALALALGVSGWSVTAQDAGGPPAAGDGTPARDGGPGGGGPGGFGRGGPGNFDPAQFQQMMTNNFRQQLDLTNDEEWNAIQPLIQKVMEAQQAAQAFGGRGGRGGPGGFGGPGGSGGRGGPSGGTLNPTVEALQTAIDSDSTDRINAAVAKYRDARKQAQDKLTAAQDTLKNTLTIKQEATALRLGLVN